MLGLKASFGQQQFDGSLVCVCSAIPYFICSESSTILEVDQKISLLMKTTITIADSVYDGGPSGLFERKDLFIPRAVMAEARFLITNGQMHRNCQESKECDGHDQADAKPLHY